MTDEKILKKVGKLLTMYGVSEEEKNGFLQDLKDAKDDEVVDSEEVESKDEEVANDSEEVVNEETPAEENAPTEKVNENEEVVDEEKVDEAPTDDVSVEEETTTEEVVEEPQEAPVEDVPPTEETEESNPATFDYKSQYEELKKSFDGLVSRLETLESIVSKMGIDVEDKTIGASPIGTPVDEERNDAFDVFMKKRLG